MDITLDHRIKAECEAALLAFGRARDMLDADASASFIASDGVWDRDGRELRGPEAVRAAVAAMPRDLVMRHVFTNVVVEVVDATHARATAYYTSYGDRGSTGGATLPLKLEGPTRVGDYSCAFVLEGGRWLIAYVTASRIFSK